VIGTLESIASRWLLCWSSIGSGRTFTLSSTFRLDNIGRRSSGGFGWCSMLPLGLTITPLILEMRFVSLVIEDFG
jgi:hypothetical protein